MSEDPNKLNNDAETLEAESAANGVEAIREEGLDEAPPEETRDPLAALEAKAKENWGLYIRATADLENYRKRAARERQEASRYANESLLTKLIPVLDSFEMALAASEGAAASSEDAVRKGIEMIRGQFLTALAGAGLEEVDATDQAFDPNLHEAVSTMESADVEEGHVLQQLRKGYRLNDRLLRPATVVVAKAPVDPEG